MDMRLDPINDESEISTGWYLGLVPDLGVLVGPLSLDPQSVPDITGSPSHASLDQRDIGFRKQVSTVEQGTASQAQMTPGPRRALD